MQSGSGDGASGWWRTALYAVGIAAGGAAAGWGQGQLRPEPPPIALPNGNVAQLQSEIREQFRRIDDQLAQVVSRAQRNTELIAGVQAELTARASERALRFAEVERSIGVLVERMSDVEASIREAQRAPRR